MTDELFYKIGNAVIYHWDEDGTGTVGEYLRDLLLTLLNEGDGFSGKRPFGNSGWESALPDALAFAGIIEYDVEDDNEGSENKGEWDIDYNYNKAVALINEYIKEVFRRAMNGTI